MKLTVVGLVGDIPFHRAQFCAQDLYQGNPDKFDEPNIQGLLEFEWDEYIDAKIKEIRGELWAFENKAIVFLDDRVLGSAEDFIQWAQENHDYEDFRPEPLYITWAEDSYREELIGRNHDYVFMDICIGKEEAGRLLVELYTDTVPKTCENFRSLCTGEKGECEHNSVETFKLHYKDSIFHRIVPKGWIQGGDIWYGKGNGGESIYGPTFEDENFMVSHDKRGIVSMANKGRHSNGSQFFFSLGPSKWMDTKFVAFGRIVEGTETLKKMESEHTVNERPLKEIKIVGCGQLEL